MQKKLHLLEKIRNVDRVFPLREIVRKIAENVEQVATFRNVLR